MSQLISINKTCPKCNKEFNLEIKEGCSNIRERQFCSRSCANSKTIDDDTKNKISNTLKLLPKSGDNKQCLNCNIEYYVKKSKSEQSKYCSKSCGSTYKNKMGLGRKAGLKSVTVQSEKRRSKNEIYFSELCMKYFKDIKINEPMFNGWDADVIIEDIKYAILWNGKWHYEKITEQHSVEQVQNRDKIKQKEIENLGYTSYIIKDMGKYDKEFVEYEMIKFMKHLTPNPFFFEGKQYNTIIPLNHFIEFLPFSDFLISLEILQKEKQFDNFANYVKGFDNEILSINYINTNRISVDFKTNRYLNYKESLEYIKTRLELDMIFYDFNLVIKNHNNNKNFFFKRLNIISNCLYKYKSKSEIYFENYLKLKYS